ncbi:fructosamine kinase family protein [Nonomuraea sp. SBT364]|uniref:fructosamine kinase family protein n=1 Tax=Nonomuraea sp. SBT364 TaxID=1580530 RepID=UPI00066EDBC4|nr:fructosamine kinase family protein [Nonomuraea sp. SBT364]
MRSAEDLGSSHGRRLQRGVLDDGRVVFAKIGAVSPVFTSEAAGLRWLGEAVTVPEVIEVADDRLVLSWVEEEPPTAAAAERLGRDLARMHRAGAPAFGAPYLDRVLGAYREEAPLADGWRERVPLHQLHPLLVHVVLYGGAYRDGLMAAVRRVLEL